jgi:hypothetical protein
MSAFLRALAVATGRQRDERPSGPLDCCPHMDLEPDIDIRGEVQTAVEETPC